MGSFWASSKIEPKRQHRWLIQFVTAGWSSHVAKKVGRPSYTIGETEHKFLNHSFWYPGRITWEAIDVEIVDLGGEQDSTLKLYEALRTAGYIFPDSSGEETISKKQAVTALGEVSIQELDAAGTPASKFILHNAWISKAQLGDLDYSGEELVSLTLTLRYDFAKYSLGNNST
jgi:hypothetical protein